MRTQDGVAFYGAFTHPIRRQILLRCVTVEACATELAADLGLPLNRVCEQVQLLAEAGLLQLVDEDLRQGGRQKFYRLDIDALTTSVGTDGENDALLFALVGVRRAVSCERIPDSLRSSLQTLGKMLELVGPPPPAASMS